MSSSRLPLFALALALLVALVVGCGPTDPAQQVIQERNQNYTVELAGWFPKKVEPVEVAMDEVGDAAEGAAEEVGDAADAMADAIAEGDAEGAGDAAAEGADAMAEGADAMGDAMSDAVEGPTTETIVFDVAVIYQGRDPLPGVTVEIAQVDGSQAEKNTWLQYLETGEMRTGESRQMSFELEDVALAEGDAFSVTLLKSVPPEDFGDYPEIAAAQQ